ncbi:hypothetical protein CDAR_181161 [Caerostris darwini]|uniref:Uncharacterized protein n=1 Tax=Caerostris darwini TaxID=1538125 RepID=A0AAV4U3Y9_9ARAC|nr:hypothetical protein CDAR_181161 [Caerostris darwini]
MANFFRRAAWKQQMTLCANNLYLSSLENSFSVFISTFIGFRNGQKKKKNAAKNSSELGKRTFCVCSPRVPVRSLTVLSWKDASANIFLDSMAGCLVEMAVSFCREA